MIILHRLLSPDALRGVIEAFIMREGTDYGVHEVPLATKVFQVQQQLVVYLPNADKYRRLPRRPPKGQKVLYERALMASQRPFHSW